MGNWWVWNPKTKQIDLTCGFDDPEKCAAYLWENYDQRVVDVKYAVKDAESDRKLYDAIEAWIDGHGRSYDPIARENNAIPESLKVPLFDLLHQREKPSAKNVTRDEKIFHIMYVLIEEFKLKHRRNTHDIAEKKETKSAATIVAALDGTPTERRVEGIYDELKKR